MPETETSTAAAPRTREDTPEAKMSRAMRKFRALPAALRSLVLADAAREERLIVVEQDDAVDRLDAKITQAKKERESVIDDFAARIYFARARGELGADDAALLHDTLTATHGRIPKD